MKTPHSDPVTCQVSCAVTQADVEAMDYWLNETAVANPPTQHALCFAIQRLVLPGTKVRLCQACDGKMCARLGEKTAVELPPNVAAWCQLALTGVPVGPTAAKLEIPGELLQPSLRTPKPELVSTVKRRLPKPCKALEMVEAA